MRRFWWTAKREEAAGLAARGDETNTSIGAAVGAAARTVRAWCERPEFRARVAEHVEAAREAARAGAIADMERRLNVANGRCPRCGR